MEAIQGRQKNSTAYKDRDGFLWKKNKELNGKTYFKCGEKGCRATCVLEDGRLTNGQPHSHAVEKANEKEVVFGFLEAATTNRRFRDIYTDAQIAHHEGALRAGHYHQVLHIMKNARSDSTPGAPRSLDALDEDMKKPSVWAKYGVDLMPDAQPFYRGILEASDGSRMVWFAPDNICRFIQAQKNVELHMDATFQVNPSGLGSTQLFIMHAQHDDLAYPIGYFLMEKRTKSAYKAAFKGWMNLFGPLDVAVIMSDYEDPLRAGATETWEAAQIRGCYFHFSQAVLRNAIKMKVARTESAEVVQMAMVLPLLPANAIKRGMDIIRTHIGLGEDSERFAKYLERWANKDISVFGLKTRTNNFAESFHSQLNSTIQVAHPGVWLFLSHLRKASHNKAMDLLRCQLGLGVKLKKSPHVVERDEQIAKAQELFVNDDDVLHLLATLRGISSLQYRRAVDAKSVPDVPVYENQEADGNDLDPTIESNIAGPNTPKGTPKQRKPFWPTVPADSPRSIASIRASTSSASGWCAIQTSPSVTATPKRSRAHVVVTAAGVGENNSQAKRLKLSTTPASDTDAAGPGPSTPSQHGASDSGSVRDATH